jgi:PAP2 superfamily
VYTSATTVRTPMGEIMSATVDWSDARRSAGLRSIVKRASPMRSRLTKELALVVVFGVIYEVLRHNMIQAGSVAARHALSIVHLEKDLHVFHEAALQTLFLRAPDLMRFFNLYYGGTHFLVPIGALLWLAWRHPERYTRARTTLAATTGVAFLCFWVFPVAPPRLLPSRFGIIDTLVTFAQTGHVENSLINSAGDVYASMPSLHVAWAVWCTLVLYPVARHRISRVLLVTYPALTTLVVLTTGNHFVLDAVAGAALVGTIWWITTKASTMWANRGFREGLSLVLHDIAPVGTRLVPSHDVASGPPSGPVAAPQRPPVSMPVPAGRIVDVPHPLTEALAAATFWFRREKGARHEPVEESSESSVCC